jgi:hypothetical protein
MTELSPEGLLLWWHHTPGLLHWALNFWFDQFSRYLVDPNADTSADIFDTPQQSDVLVELCENLQSQRRHEGTIDTGVDESAALGPQLLVRSVFALPRRSQRRHLG